MATETVAVLGLGLLGAGFAQKLAENGFQVRVANRTAAKAIALAGPGIVACETFAEAVAGADRVHLVLSEDDAVDSVLAQIRGNLAEGVPVIDHSTNLPDRVAARCAQLWADGVQYLHAPVFMGPRDSRAATGLMLIAGPTAIVEALTPKLQAMTGRVWHVGERTDLAALHKLSGNALILGLAGLLGDVLKMGAHHGLSTDEVLGLFQVFTPGGALPFVGQRVAHADTNPTSFSLTMARKDLRLMLENASGGAPLTTLPAVAAAMDAALAKGLAEKDFAIYAR